MPEAAAAIWHLGQVAEKAIPVLLGALRGGASCGSAAAILRQITPQMASAVPELLMELNGAEGMARHAILFAEEGDAAG